MLIGVPRRVRCETAHKRVYRLAIHLISEILVEGSDLPPLVTLSIESDFESAAEEAKQAARVSGSFAIIRRLADGRFRVYVPEASWRYLMRSNSSTSRLDTEAERQSREAWSESLDYAAAVSRSKSGSGWFYDD